jgi:hypothetical protein
MMVGGSIPPVATNLTFNVNPATIGQLLKKDPLGKNMNYWVSWYNKEPLKTFEPHSPWWISGYDSDDNEIIVAAIRAESENEAWEVVNCSYDDTNPLFVKRFITEQSDDWVPFCDRFPKSPWMDWTDLKTCACGAHE